MVEASTTDDHRLVAEELARDGLSIVPGVVPLDLVAAVSAAADRAVALEEPYFPPGTSQNGRVLFGPAYGGALLELCAFDPLFAPIEALLGEDSILYALTTSILQPGSAGPIDSYHVDLAGDRPDGLALSAIVLLDPFTADNGATEFLVGSHRWGDRPLDDSLQGELISGEPGDVCYFDPRIRHRTTTNRTDRARRAIPLQMVRPWMKQRVDVREMMDHDAVDALGPTAARRLGLTTTPPRSVEEFVARGAVGRRPG